MARQYSWPLRRSWHSSSTTMLLTLTRTDFCPPAAVKSSNSITLSGNRLAGARAPCAAPTSPIRQTLSQVKQEQLARFGSNCRSRNQAEHGVCADQDPRSNSIYRPCRRHSRLTSMASEYRPLQSPKPAGEIKLIHTAIDLKVEARQ